METFKDKNEAKPEYFIIDDSDENDVIYVCHNREMESVICQVESSEVTFTEDFERANLICEAFNVANETNQTPRQLKEDLDRAVEMVEKARDNMSNVVIKQYLTDFLTSIENKRK